MKPTLKTSICRLDLSNPTILASGIMGVSASSLKFVEKSGAGAVTLKSIGPTERAGHHNPTVISWGHGVQNAVGLSNPGIDLALPMILEMTKSLKVPLIGSMFADKVSNFVMIAEKMATSGVGAIEMNLSCPNTEDDFGRMFALDPKVTEKLVFAVRKVVGQLPIFVKLSADSPDIASVAKAAEQGGADAITAINTVSGMIIDVKLRRPILTNKVGGISGPAIKPIGVRAVYNIYKSVKIPIIGVGGIETGMDALEYIMAGATCVGIGSAVYSQGIGVFEKITTDMSEFMKKNDIKSLGEIRGAAHNC